MAVAPYLFNNSDCWVNIPRKAINVLNAIHNAFFVSLFGTSTGCPIPIFYWDSGILTPENQIILKKLLFYHHLLTLPENSLAREIVEIQKERILQGLVKECDNVLNDLEITSDPSNFTKKHWKKIAKEAIQKKNRTELLDRMKSYKKLEPSRFAEEDCGAQPYLKNMNISYARTFFSSRAHMLKSVQMNFKRKEEYAANQYKCSCGEEDHQSHLISCPSYQHLRQGLDLERSDSDLVRYYQLIIKEREQKEDKGKL